ncbi:MAG TPA: RNHCP domain-containing protein [Ktedonobacterales bacterium]
MPDHRTPGSHHRDDQRRNNRRAGPSYPESRGVPGRRDASATATARDATFTCGHCGRRVGPLPSGGRNRNHCPYCLYSRHVDGDRSGDRASPCKGMMEPIGVFERPNGEEVITHRCLVCGFERFNRVGADDDEATVAALPRIAPRQAARDH